MNNASAPPAEDADRILLVDDDVTNLDVLRHTLDGRGYRLFVTRSGESAIEVARRVHPLLILLDVVMPGIDGYETCRRLKEDPETREAAVIFLSSLDETKDKVRGLEVGAVDFVSKPFQRDEVVARVNTHLTMQRLRRQLEAQERGARARAGGGAGAPDGRAAPGGRPAARRQPRDPGAARIDRTIRRRRGSRAADRPSRCGARGSRSRHPPRLAAQPPGLHPRQLRTAAAGAGSRHPESAGGSFGAGIRLAPEPAGAGHPRHAIPRRNPATARRPAGTVGRSPRGRRGRA